MATDDDDRIGWDRMTDIAGSLPSGLDQLLKALNNPDDPMDGVRLAAEMSASLAQLQEGLAQALLYGPPT
ncbi:MAG: hypothetical protein F4Y45_10750 [Acidobacteria bacterium]|nr:hypothetical protein [Acidobacteriota bacterium]